MFISIFLRTLVIAMLFAAFKFDGMMFMLRSMGDGGATVTIPFSHVILLVFIAALTALLMETFDEFLKMVGIK